MCIRDSFKLLVTDTALAIQNLSMLVDNMIVLSGKIYPCIPTYFVFNRFERQAEMLNGTGTMLRVMENMYSQ